MKFKPVTPKYDFKGESLTKSYPDYLTMPIAVWIREVLVDANILHLGGYLEDSSLERYFVTGLNINLRESFPTDPDEFLRFIFKDEDRLTNVIAVCLQNYALVHHARKLEATLSVGGSGYSVYIPQSSAISEFSKGVSDLVERVPQIVLESARSVIEVEPLLNEAWKNCYSRNPDYEKTVSKAVDALETLLKANYFPKDGIPSLGKFIANLKGNPKALAFKGDTLLDNKSSITDLAEKFVEIRGHHTSGTGRAPTKEEAEFVLHYAILLFQLHN